MKELYFTGQNAADTEERRTLHIPLRELHEYPVRLYEMTGPTLDPVISDIRSGVHFSAIDNMNFHNECDFVVIPLEGVNYSFEKTLFLVVLDTKAFSDMVVRKHGVEGFSAIRKLGIYLGKPMPQGTKLLARYSDNQGLLGYNQAEGLIGKTGYLPKGKESFDMWELWRMDRPFIIYDSIAWNSCIRSELFHLQLQIDTTALPDAEKFELILSVEVA